LLKGLKPHGTLIHYLPANLNNFSIIDADMQIILDGLAVDMDQILAALNFDP
jgi:hypothetical protein